MAGITSHDERGRYAIDFELPRMTVGRPPRLRGLRGLSTTLTARRLARRVQRQFGTFDRIWERASLHSDAGVRLARAFGAEHWLEVNAPLDLEARRAGRLGWAVRRADRVVAVSDWMVAWARQTGARRVTRMPNATDLVAGDVPRVPDLMVHHGSLRPWHGTAFFPELLEALPSMRLRVIGSGRVPEHPRLERLPWLPSDRLAPALQEAAVGLLPYPDDAPPWLDPLKAADYRAVGVPTVGSLHPAARGATRQVGLRDHLGWVEAVEALVTSCPVPTGPSWEEAIRSLSD